MVRQIEDPESGVSKDEIDALERTLDTVREDSEVAHVLLGLSSALAEVRTVEDTLDTSVRMILELYGGDRCLAVSWDDVNDRWEVRALYGYDAAGEALLHEFAQSRDGLPFSARTLEEGVPVLVPNTLEDATITEDVAKRRSLGAYIGIPLHRWGQDFGSLGVEYSQPRTFGAKDAALARGIARQVGVALANARRFNLLQALRSFGLRSGTQLRLAEVVDHATKGARKLMSAGASAVYFFDSHNKELVSSATHGLSDETAGLVARIDVSREPWSDLLEGRTVFVPNLREVLDAEAAPASAVAAGIPGAGPAPMGALFVFYRKSAHLGPDEIEALNVAAAQSASAIENARRFERQRRVARSLQEGLMAGAMPEMKGCEVGAVYEPAGAESDVGGDFFDAFELDEERVALVVGDVSGKGAEAAALTAQAKYMLRAFAMRNPAPASVLFHLNNALVQGMAEDRFMTAVYGVFEPEARSCQIALGGHPSPLVYRSATHEIQIPNLNGSLIGAFENQQYESVTLEMNEGDVLLAYTDGLLEARNGNDLFGRDRIAESLKKHAQVKSAREIAQAMYQDAQAFGELADDTVVIALACNGGPPANQ